MPFYFSFLLSASCVFAAGPNDPNITSFTPSSGSTGTVITITGSNFFSSTSAVTIGGTAATSFTVNSTTSISATVGSGATGTISVTNYYGTAISTGTFTYAATPTITSFSPQTAAPGTVVAITGTNFTGATAVSFGGTAAASYTVNSATSISATLGSGATGTVSVTTPNGTATSSGTFYLIPTITSFSPTSGGAGTVVSITGTNFTPVTAVSFGGTAAASFTVNSATSISATLGSSGASGTIGVTIPCTGGTVNSTGSYTYLYPSPTITSFSPSNGSYGTVVTISGTNFVNAANVTQVTFGGTPADSYTVPNASTISATVGYYGSTGTIAVTTQSGTATSTGAFSYNCLTPTITSFGQSSGSAGTNVEIQGSNFYGVNSVCFGGTPATSFTIISDAEIIAILGSGSSGPISAANPAGTATSSGTFYCVPTISSFSPSSGAAALR